MKERMIRISACIKYFFEKYNREIIFSIGMVIVGVLSFEGGMVHGLALQSKPLVIEKVLSNGGVIEDVSSQNDSKANNVLSENQDKVSIADNAKKCMFVGSKNSDKYHIPTCSFAKRIKPENIVCFSSEEDAKSKGYQPGCIK